MTGGELPSGWSSHYRIEHNRELLQGENWLGVEALDILLVEDNSDSRACISEFLNDLGHRVVECKDGMEALKEFAKDEFQLVFTDIKMPRLDGIDLLRKLSLLKTGRNFDVVVFTGHGDMNSAIEAMRAGARDYLLKPINVERLPEIIERIAEEQAQYRERRSLPDGESKVAAAVTDGAQVDFTGDFMHIRGIGQIGVFSDSMKEIVRQSLNFHRDRDLSVLIEGETGTGKEIIARLIHYGLSACGAPFVDINCAALTSTLFESELFGYEPGAYTGGLAKGSKGKLDLAAGGTLFLDEIGELSIDLQAKLLRVIQEREYYRVGGLKKITADVRIICATNRDLEAGVKNGTFRPDLYYRLQVGRLKLPPLRERREAISQFAQMFLAELAGKRDKRFKRISDSAGKMMADYYWPGNVRELRNILERVVFNYDEEELKPEHLMGIFKTEPREAKPVNNIKPFIDPVNFSLPFEGLPLEEYMEKIINKALEMNNGNKAKTARYLGISRRSLYCKLERMRENR